MDEFTVVTWFPALPERVYAAWIDADAHAAMTGAEATSDPRPLGAFTAWDGYIEGRYLELDPGHRILMRWRTSEFADGAGDSRVEVRFDPSDGGTQLTLRHTELAPGDGPKYDEGWRDFYFRPMTEYFGG